MSVWFSIRFELAEVPFWGERYSYQDDGRIRAIGAAAGRRGWYTRDEFLAVMRWKTPRTQSRCAENTEGVVVERTRLALGPADERVRMKALMSLHGVAFPTASTLLHFARPDAYPILDVRALWSLGVDEAPRFYSFGFWWDYVEACRRQAAEAGVSLRTLDRALWQYSKSNQRPTGSARQSRATSVRPVIRSGASKSARMREMFEHGQSVAEVAKSLGVPYGFAYGVHRRWLMSKA